MNPFQNHYCQTSKWFALHQSLVRSLHLLPTTEWTPTISPTHKQIDDEERMRLQTSLKKAYNEVFESTNAAIVHLLKESAWPELSAQETYFLHMNLSSAILFVQSVVIDRSGSPTTIFPFPDMDPMLVEWWILTEWWMEHGLHEACRAATTDEMIFHKYFS